MPEVTHFLDQEATSLVYFNNGARAVAYRTASGMWLIGEAEIVDPPPDDGFVYPFNFDFATSEFGTRVDPFGSGKTVFHSGIDGSTSAGVGGGDPVIAAGAGTVAAAGWNVYGSWGTSVIIDHGIVSGNHLKTGYAHMVTGSLTVSVGDSVVAGETIGTVDSTGLSTGNHLHFSTWENGQLINPRNFMMTYGS